MRWFWSRRKGGKPQVSSLTPADEPVGGVARGTRTGTLVAGGEPKDALLRFAREYLLACGAHVRMEGEETLSASLPDGTSVRYTTSLARARAEEETRYLAEGTAALAEMLERSATEARLTALRLAPDGDSVALGLRACAEPAVGCGRCLAADLGATGAAGPRGVPLCAECPLREGRLLFAGLEGARRAEVVREWEAQGAELTYVLAGRNRQGRQDEWVRVAVLDTHGRRCQLLSPDNLSQAQPGTLTSTAAEVLESATRAAEAELTPAIEAAACYLRLRTEDEYQRRIEETRATSRRLRGEDPDQAREIDAALDRELAALVEVYAVEVEARLESICLIASPVAEVRIRGAERGELTLLVERGRGRVLPPLCGDCGQPCSAGSVCGVGHVRCASCERVCAACGARTCPVCSETRIIACASCGTKMRERRAPAISGGRATSSRDPQTVRRSRPTDEGVLSIAHLEAMTPATWRACAAWLLEHEGYQLDLPEERGELLVWRGRLGERAALTAALRLPAGWPLEAEHERRVAALAAGMAPRELMLRTTAMPTEGAPRAGERLGVRTLARPALAETLARAATAHQRERAQAHEDGAQRAEAAAATRKALLAALKTAESALKKGSKAKPATSRAAVVAAAREVLAAHQAAARALLAWETLVADWLAEFGERAERDGTLRLVGDEASFTELAERCGHLREALGAVAQQLQRTPVAGELGYDMWRALVIEELTTRLDALRERIRMFDPARWQDFSVARDLTAEAAAARAATNADRTAARAEQAYAQLAQRAGLEK
jgi:hypothetical protein